MPQSTGEGWMSSGDASAYLGITPRTLYRLIDEGELPGYKVGRVIRVKRADVEAFIEGCRIEPGTISHLYPKDEGSRPRRSPRKPEDP